MLIAVSLVNIHHSYNFFLVMRISKICLATFKYTKLLMTEVTMLYIKSKVLL